MFLARTVFLSITDTSLSIARFTPAGPAGLFILPDVTDVSTQQQNAMFLAD
jgi:hypothetical protein